MVLEVPLLTGLLWGLMILSEDGLIQKCWKIVVPQKFNEMRQQNVFEHTSYEKEEVWENMKFMATLRTS